MPSFAIVDTSVILSAVHVPDPDHVRSLAALSRGDLDYVYPVMVLAEAAYMIDRDLGPLAESQFLETVTRLAVEAPAKEDWRTIADLVAQYRDLRIGGTDASIVALARRLNTDLVLTLDQRHFRAVRPLHCEAFRLLP